MLRKVSLFGLVLFLSLTQSLFAQFKSTEGKFSMNFPATPEETESSPGIFNVTANNGVEYFMVVFTKMDEPSTKSTSLKLVDVTKEAFLEKFGGKILSTKPFEYQGWKGYETKISKEQDGFTFYITYRVFMVNSHLYQLMHMNDSNDAAKAKKFLDTFKYNG